MSTFKGNAVRHLNSTVDNITLDLNGNTTVKALTASSLNSGSVTVTNDLVVNGDTTIGSDSSDNLTVNATVSGSSFNAGIIGEIRMYAGSQNAPSGWIYCNGGTIGNTGSGATFEGSQYNTLFELLKGNWGNTGNPSWTGGDVIKLPDFRGAFPIGTGQNQGNVRYKDGTSSLNTKGTTIGLSATGGKEEHILTAGEVDVHSHSTTTTTGSTANITSNQTNTETVTISTDSAGDITVSVTDPGHGHTVSNFYHSSNNSGSVYAVIQEPRVGIRSNLGVPTATTGISATATQGTHTHTSTAHSHTITQTNHDHSVSITATAGDFNDPHSIMPPYIGVNFIIKY